MSRGKRLCPEGNRQSTQEHGTLQWGEVHRERGAGNRVTKTEEVEGKKGGEGNRQELPNSGGRGEERAEQR